MCHARVPGGVDGFIEMRYVSVYILFANRRDLFAFDISNVMNRNLFSAIMQEVKMLVQYNVYMCVNITQSRFTDRRAYQIIMFLNHNFSLTRSNTFHQKKTCIFLQYSYHFYDNFICEFEQGFFRNASSTCKIRIIQCKANDQNFTRVVGWWK